MAALINWKKNTVDWDGITVCLLQGEVENITFPPWLISFSVRAASVWPEKIRIHLLTNLSIRQSHTVRGNSLQKEQETPTVLHKLYFWTGSVIVL